MAKTKNTRPPTMVTTPDGTVLERCKLKDLGYQELIDALWEAEGSKTRAAYILTEKKGKAVSRIQMHQKIIILRKHDLPHDPKKFQKYADQIDALEEFYKDLTIDSWNKMIADGEWHAVHYSLRARCGIYDEAPTSKASELSDERKRLLLGDLDSDLRIGKSSDTAAEAAVSSPTRALDLD